MASIPHPEQFNVETFDVVANAPTAPINTLGRDAAGNGYRSIGTGWIQTDVNGAASVVQGSGSIIALGTSTAVETSSATPVKVNQKRVEGLLTGTGTISATVEVYAVNTNRIADGLLIGTLSISGTTQAAHSFLSDAPSPYLYYKVTAISGTGASVGITVGV